MTPFSTDRDWAKLGEIDPYWAVLTNDQFHGADHDARRRAEFLRMGHLVIDEMFATIHRCFDADFQPESALDFGCGVGRLTLPLAERCRRVVGVDVSPGMLSEAGKNCQARGFDHVELCESDDTLSRVTGTFDLIVSRIVFQHIPAPRGERLLERLLELLNPDGIGSLHFYCGQHDALEQPPVAGWRKLAWAMRAGLRSSLVRIGGRPVMEMHACDLNRILMRLRHVGARDIFCRLKDQGQCLSATLYFRKAGALPE